VLCVVQHKETSTDNNDKKNHLRKIKEKDREGGNRKNENCLGALLFYLLWLLCFVADSGLCEGPITRPGEPYRECIIVCDHMQQ
jgi:hypothetical protein